MDDRLHRAAKDGFLAPLNKATKKDLNYPDEEGMTPTLWAAYSGQLRALQVCCSRGGDPNKCDFIGNTALHFAARRGYLHCLTFLISFGVNLWHMDNDYHTALDISGLRDNKDCMRLLDDVIEKETKTNKKKADKLQKKAHEEAEKRIKQFEKMQEKLHKNSMSDPYSRPPTISDVSRERPFNPNYSQATQSRKSDKTSILQPKKGDNTIASYPGGSDFKISEEGRKTVRSLPGVPSGNSSNVIYQSSDNMIQDEVDGSNSGRKKIPSLFLQGTWSPNSGGIGSAMRYQPSFYPGMENGNGNYDTYNVGMPERGYPSIGSAGSLMFRNGLQSSHGHEYVDEDTSELSALDTFLASLKLLDYKSEFEKEKIDMESLMLCTDEDLKDMYLPLGPRKKILMALEERKRSQEDRQPLEDTKF